MTPEARRDQLLIQEVGDELVVYDRVRHRAYLLNRTVALVWRHCDGRRTVADLAALLQSALHLPAAEETLVWLALRRLEEAHLLQDGGPRPASAPGISRRQALRQLRLAGGLLALAPAITSILAPTPAMAASCAPSFAKEGLCVDECFLHQDCGPLGFCGIVACPDDPFRGHFVCVTGCPQAIR